MATKKSDDEETVLQAYKPAIGIDVGTYTIVRAKRNADGDIEYLTEINGFLEMEVNMRTKIMLNNIKASGIPSFMTADGEKAYILGKKARNFAYSHGALFSGQNVDEVFKRPMRDGLLSSRDSRDSFNVLATLVNSMIGDIDIDNMPIAYSVPGVPVPQQGKQSDSTVSEYHSSVISKMLQEVDGHRTDPFSINEAEAIVWAECEDKGLSGIGMSFGAGMTNVCFSLYGMPVFTFSAVGGGDSVDRAVAKRCGIDPVVANIVKMGDEGSMPPIDLLKTPSGANEHIERAIIMHYNMLINDVVAAFGQYVRDNEKRVMESSKPDIIVAGGTASPNGFMKLLIERLDQENMKQFRFGDTRKADNNLHTVAKGLLRCAETYDRSK